MSYCISHGGILYQCWGVIDLIVAFISSVFWGCEVLIFLLRIPNSLRGPDQAGWLANEA